MITKATALVLGAGASASYGYPAGKSLMDVVTRELNNPDSELYKFLLTDNYPVSDIGDFREGLINSATESIDEFLENRTTFTDIGKLCITFILASTENPTSLQQTADKNWYGLLLRKLCDGSSFEGIKDNKISIITFNYDRSLEQYFAVALQHRFGKTEKEVAEIIKTIPIIHVHGQIGNLACQHNTSIRSYGEYSKFDQLVESSKLIRIIHEANAKEDPIFLEARKRLSEANSIYFLGFGYHRENLRRLDVASLDNNRNTIWGTSFHLNARQRNEAMTRASNKIDLKLDGAGSYDVFTFLNENVTFI